MSHLSLYFTRGTPRSTTPAFTLDFSKEPYLEALAERLYQQYTYGLAQPSQELEQEQSGNFVTHGHTTFEQSELGWVAQGEEAVGEESLVTPTFNKPKPTDIALTNGHTSSSSVGPAVTQRAPPLGTFAPAKAAALPLKESPGPVNAAKPAQEPAPVNSTEAPQESSANTTASSQAPPAPVNATVPPPAAPQEAPPISLSKPTRATVPIPARPEDLRRSVALLNANRSQNVKAQPATQVTSQASNKATKPATPLRLPDSSMSSSEYRPSSPSSKSSRSPTPKSPPKTASPGRRRSTRSRAETVTYNLYALSRRQRGSHDSQSDREDSSAVSGSPPPPTSPRPSLRHRQSLQPRQPSQQRQTTQPRQTSHVRPSLQDFPVEIQTERGPWHEANLSRLLWTRELRGARPSHDLVRATVSSNLKLCKFWKGLSNDVTSIAWSPDGTKFAVGATAHDDQYNRGNNLVLGDLSQNRLYELPDHNIFWKSNAATADERLFPTVSSIQWVGQRLYTASYDDTVKIWDADTLRASDTLTCVRTLQHDSNVRVMSVSNLMPHLVATGTAHAFNLWNLLGKPPTPKSLEIHRDPRQKAGIVLEPTVLAWGQNAATKHYLVGGMAEHVPGADQDEEKKSQVVAHGHLGMWRVTESSIKICKLRGADSQNTFDLKWHPSMRRFATGSRYSQSMNLPLRSKSAVQLWDIEPDDRAVVTSKFACSAADMNEVTFCPMDSTYITASCTDGSTYVWDARYGERPIHKLNHGPSVRPLNPRFARELTDFGVRVALWGTTIDQFYTGSSDGFLKQWDIRRSTEDALVANTVQLNDGIVSGAFSADKSQLLLGDYGGGIHVLSCEQSKHERVDFVFKPAPEPPSAEEPGMSIAKEYLALGQLTLHPVFGPVQGPQYNGPYASWARGLPQTATRDKLKRTPLLSEYQVRQFEGPPLDDRQGLDPESRRDLQCHFNLARARHARRGRSGGEKNLRKRKRDRVDFGGIEKDSHASSSSPARKKKKMKKDRLKKRRHSHVITRIEESVIDLTMDSDSEPAVSTSVPTPAPVPLAAAVVDSTMDPGFEPLEQSLDRQLSLSPVPKVLEEVSDGEDYWWPDSRDVDANLSPDDL